MTQVKELLQAVETQKSLDQHSCSRRTRPNRARIAVVEVAAATVADEVAVVDEVATGAAGTNPIAAQCTRQRSVCKTAGPVYRISRLVKIPLERRRIDGQAPGPYVVLLRSEP